MKWWLRCIVWTAGLETALGYKLILYKRTKVYKDARDGHIREWIRKFR